MPKTKSNSGAKKRFRLTAKGKIKRRRANTSHILTKKAPKRKRHLRSAGAVDATDVRRVRRLLGH